MWSERSGSQHQEKTLLLRGAAKAGFYLQFTKYRRRSPSVFRQIHVSVRQTAGPSPSQSLVSWSHHMTRNDSSHHQWVILSDFFFSPQPPKKTLKSSRFFLSSLLPSCFYLSGILASRRASKLVSRVFWLIRISCVYSITAMALENRTLWLPGSLSKLCVERTAAGGKA